MKKHKCHPIDYCICIQTSLEPNEYCPIHGGCKEYPERCVICGRFIKTKEELSDIAQTKI